MKKIIILLIVALCVGTACNKQMDFDPYKQVPPTQFWVTEADAISAIVACYFPFTDWPFYNPTTFALQEIASDNTTKGSDVGDDDPTLAFKTFQFTAANERFDDFWKSRYSGINRCNQAITNIAAMDLAETIKTPLIAEAKFIRAWLYFELVRNFGEVIIYDGIPTDNAYDTPQSSIPEVYTFIEEDLKAAFSGLRKDPWPINMKGRVTAWAARALEAKVKMYEASGANFSRDGQPINGVTWNDVKTVTDDVILNGIYSLYEADGDDSFFNLFRVQNENCVESIFESQNGASLMEGSINRSCYACYQWVRGGEFAGWGFNVPTDQMLVDWEARTDDVIRYKASVIFRGETTPDGTLIEGNTTLAGTNAGKPGAKPARYNYKVYIDPADEQLQGGWMRYVEQNGRLFRFADVLLIDAEAEFNVGGPGAALESINKVRNRVRATPYTSANLTLQTIWDERRFELAFENDRFYDLVRTGQAKTRLAGNGFVFPKNCFYPVPQNQIDLSNGILKQNPNWM